MKALLLLSCLMVFSAELSADTIDFTATARQALNNEMIQSPVFTKMLYRQIYENDTNAYYRQMQLLNNQKKQGKLSNREHLAQVEALKKAYQMAHPIPLSEQGTQITQNPVDMLLHATFSNHRRPLIQVIQSPKTTQPAQQKSTTLTPDTQPNTPNPSQNMAVIKLKNTQKLGKKTLPINLDAFK